MNNSVEAVGQPDEFYDDLERITTEVLGNIDATIQGTVNVNLTEELFRFFNNGISVFYYNASIVSAGVGFNINDMQRTCAINEIYSILFPSPEPAEIASLANSLQQIAVAYEVARAVSRSHFVCVSVSVCVSPCPCPCSCPHHLAIS